MDFRDQIYKSYGEFKGWEKSEVPENYFDMYEGELRQHQIKAPGRLLEIGFGNGHFLNWAKNRGFQPVGIEVNSDFVNQALKNGLEVFLLPLQNLDQLKSSHDTFEYIVLFDILEHLYPSEIIELFEKLKKIISSEGIILCRFPNGLSPFFTQTQWADITHVTVLTPERIRQIGMATGFELLKYGNSYRSLVVGKRSKFLRVILYNIRSIFEFVFGFLYFGGQVPLDPNMTLSLRLRKKNGP